MNAEPVYSTHAGVERLSATSFRHHLFKMCKTETEKGNKVEILEHIVTDWKDNGESRIVPKILNPFRNTVILPDEP